MNGSDRLADAIRQEMEARGFNQKLLAVAAGLNETAVRDILVGRAKSPKVETVERIAHALGVTVGHLLGEDRGLAPVPLTTVEVIGAVQAGHWVESLEWPHEDRWRVPIPVLPPEYRNPQAAVVRGNSMNRVYPAGTVVVFVGLGDYPHKIEDGDHVIVRRRDRHGLFELTVKELRTDETGRKWLWPRSDDPQFQAPLELPKPENGEHHAGAADLEIIAVVIAFVGTRR